MEQIGAGIYICLGLILLCIVAILFGMFVAAMTKKPKHNMQIEEEKEEQENEEDNG